MKPSLKLGKYQHFKGNHYQVIDLVRHSEDGSYLVLYRPLYGQGDLWVRPYDMFTEKVVTDKGSVHRFKYVSD